MESKVASSLTFSLDFTDRVNYDLIGQGAILVRYNF